MQRRLLGPKRLAIATTLAMLSRVKTCARRRGVGSLKGAQSASQAGGQAHNAERRPITDGEQVDRNGVEHESDEHRAPADV